MINDQLISEQPIEQIESTDTDTAIKPKKPKKPTLSKPKSKLSQEKLELFLSEMRHEWNWRDRANRCCAYYDGEQRDSKSLHTLQSRGLPILVRNEIAPAIDVLLGMEAKNKTRTKVVADSRDENKENVAKALTSEMIKTERVTRTARACSDAYAEMLKSGLSWVEVANEDDKFRGDIAVNNVNRKEIYWDWRAKRPDLLDARYLIRRQFIDKDTATAMFPEHKELIDNMIANWSNWDAWETSLNHQYLAGCYDLEHSRTTMPQDEWISTDRKRVCIYEVWYRTVQNTTVFTDPNGIVQEFDKNNLAHATLVAAGIVELQKSRSSNVRITWYIGPHQISDEPTPYNHKFFPYVPFWGFRDDEHQMPASLVARMLSPQDEINARLSKLMDLLSSKRVIADSDAFDLRYNNMAKVREQVASANSFILTNPDRKKDAGINIQTDITLADRQYEMLNSASQALKEIAGINTAMQGQATQSNQSGIAVNSLIEQGNIATAELNDNFRYSRTMVSELILASIKAKLSNKEQSITIKNDDIATEDETVILNQQAIDDVGQPYIANSIMQSRTEVEIEEIPAHQSVKQQQFLDLMDFTKKLPPEMAMTVAPYLVLTSDLEYKKEIYEALKQGAGGGDEEMTPEQQEAMEKQKQLDDLMMRKEEALVAKEEAMADKLRAETVSTSIGSTYEAVQSAGALSMQPELIPVADSILKSSGFEDQNEFPIATVQNQVRMTDGQVPQQMQEDELPISNNTSPMYPDVMPSAGEGLNTGIETHRIEDN